MYIVIVNAVFCEEKEKFKYMYLLNFAKRNTRKDKQLITYRGWMQIKVKGMGKEVTLCKYKYTFLSILSSQLRKVLTFMSEVLKKKKKLAYLLNILCLPLFSPKNNNPQTNKQKSPAGKHAPSTRGKLFKSFSSIPRKPQKTN